MTNDPLLNLTLWLLSGMAISSALSRDAAAQNPQDRIPAEVDAAYEKRVFEDSHGEKLPYRLLAPSASANTEKPAQLPLLLLLHGAGERGDDNYLQLIHGAKDFASQDFQRRHPAVVVIPQCPVGKQWVDVPWSDSRHTQPGQPAVPQRQVIELLADLQTEFSIDPDRVYATGLSMGGFGVWDLMARQPQLVAGAIPICGGGDVTTCQQIVHVPIWVFHGDADDAVPVSRSRDMIAALRAAGGRPIYTEYEGVGHNSWSQTFSNRCVWDWLFTQRRGRQQEPTASR
jgi:predicted peptidase